MGQPIEDIVAEKFTSLAGVRRHTPGFIAPMTLLNAAPAAAYLVSAEGILLECNTTFAAIVGKSAEELTGKNLREVLRGADWGVHERAFEHCVQHAETVRYELLTQKGWRAFSLYPVSAAGQRVACVAGYALLLSSQPARGVATFSAESLTQVTQLEPEKAHAARAAMAYLSPTGQVMQASTAICEMLGLQQQELRGRSLAELFHPEDRELVQRHISCGVLAGVDGVSFDARLCIEEQPERWCKVSCLGVNAAEELPLFGVVVLEDVSEVMQLRADAVRAGQLASLGELAAGVAHEINNPVNGIINYAQILLELVEQKEAGFEADLSRKIIKEGSRIADIVHNLLFFARDRKQSLNVISMPTVLSESLDLTRSLLQREGIDLDIVISPDLPLVRGRSRELQQVFLNVISNARYALNLRYEEPCPDKRLTIRLFSERRQGGQWIVTEFEDSGGGIPRDIHARVLNPFFSTKPEREGTGLGLSISQSILQAHGGVLDLESDGQNYTRVLVRLPVSSGAE
ncbi:PAS domain-containing protein [Oleidesulfovibrio sp.]|uniref:PAS domain-containing protein n=1 Tax=Oleidesulfovibrio sp. TaxID=2909707 RepID=UPI003A8B2D9C